LVTVQLEDVDAFRRLWDVALVDGFTVHGVDALLKIAVLVVAPLRVFAGKLIGYVRTAEALGPRPATKASHI
jgi:hypothetical protein